jgi:hypothetical protein
VIVLVIAVRLFMRRGMSNAGLECFMRPNNVYRRISLRTMLQPPPCSSLLRSMPIATRVQPMAQPRYRSLAPHASQKMSGCRTGFPHRHVADEGATLLGSGLRQCLQRSAVLFTSS